VLHYQVVDKLVEDLLRITINGAPVAEVAVKEANLLWVGAVGDEEVAQLNAWVAEEEGSLVGLFLGQRLVQESEDVFTGKVGAGVQVFAVIQKRLKLGNRGIHSNNMQQI
jgi:hypothetical protein